jgi:Uma2 family endonuclease
VATTLISLEEYLQTSYEPDMEFVDGVLVERNTGTPLHAFLMAIVCAYILQFRGTHRICAMIACRLLMGAASRRYRIPDVMVLEPPYPKGKVATEVPAAVIEIKSPDDTLDEVIDKCLEYAALGVPNIVVMDPDHRRVYVFSDNALRLAESVVLHLPKSGIDLPFPADQMFAEIDLD